MTLLENPVINMICKHHYSRAAIESYVDSKLRNRQRVRCPVAGCTNGHVTIEQLEDDSEIALLIRRFKRQEVKQSQQFASQAENLADSDDE
jgi:SUMO ligase MMS21 Smc5/6 complex component